MDSPDKKLQQAQKNRKEFMKQNPMSPAKKKQKARGNPENAPEGANTMIASPKLGMNDQSYDTYGLDNEDSVSQHNPNIISGLSQEGEKIESLLERLEESRMPEKGFTIQERNIILEDTQSLAMLSRSDTLHRIFQLMCNAQDNFKNYEESFKEKRREKVIHDKRDVKMSFDLEFEKLLLMLKDEYHSLFDKRKLKIKRQEINEENYDQDDSDQESDSPSEELNPSEIKMAKKFSINMNSGLIREENQEKFNPAPEPEVVDPDSKSKLKVRRRRYAAKKRYAKA